MTTLRQILDQTLELLEAEGKYKSFGDLSKGKFQAQKAKTEDSLIRKMMYEGQKVPPEIVKRQAAARKASPKAKKSIPQAAKNRAAWYQNPENKAKFLAALNKRDKKRREKKENQSSTNNP